MEPISSRGRYRYFQKRKLLTYLIVILQLVLLKKRWRKYINNRINSRSRGRRWWIFPRSTSFWDHICNTVWLNIGHEDCDKQWKRHFRMGLRTFEKLVFMLTPFIQKNHTSYRDAIHINKACAVVLHRLAHNTPLMALSEMFCIGISTITNYTEDICSVLAGPLHTTFIQRPHGPMLQEIINGFKELTGISQIGGVIDGTHVYFSKRPVENAFEYFDRFRRHSVTLQAICDHRLLFWDVFCDRPGSTHDSTVFQASSIYTRLRNRQILREPVEEICGTTVRPVIIGDAAYPLSNFLIKGYRARASGDARKNAFDKALSIGRVRIEMAFGVLKGRFEILRRIAVKDEMVPTVAVACCVLHNFIILNGEPLPARWRQFRMPDAKNGVAPPSRGGRSTARDALFRQFCNDDFVVAEDDEVDE